jgi:hypothetical protein
MSDELDRQRLGAAVAARREKLRMTRHDVQAKGGPSAATQSRIEKGTALNVEEATKEDHAMALGWTPESFNDILAGGEPTLALPAGTGGRAEVLSSEDGEQLLIDIVTEAGKLPVVDRREVLAIIKVKQGRDGT